MFKTLAIFSLLFCLIGCADSQDLLAVDPAPIVVGAERMDLYLPALHGKTIGVVANHTSYLGDHHLVDTLLALDIDVKVIMSPEHGFRGTADAGAKIEDGIDSKTGLPIISLYGKHRKPTPTDLADIDVVLFDLQDVGVRFYTYISTLTLVMEASAEQAIPVIVLDRPNPNAHYVDGPVLDSANASFVGMHPVPIVYGMTIGEYAKMVNGERWLDNQLTAALTVIPCKHYKRDLPYHLPIPPSPNLPNYQSVALYPSLCLMEGTVMSVGRGTDLQFQIYGHPSYPTTTFNFTPAPNVGAKRPKLEGKLCNGVDLSSINAEKAMKHGFRLDYLIDAYQRTATDAFFLANRFFDKLAGNSDLRSQILAGVSEEDIRASWQSELDAFLILRQQYLIYP